MSCCQHKPSFAVLDGRLGIANLLQFEVLRWSQRVARVVWMVWSLMADGCAWSQKTYDSKWEKFVDPKDPWRNHKEPSSYSRLPDRRVLTMLILNAGFGFQPQHTRVANRGFHGFFSKWSFQKDSTLIQPKIWNGILMEFLGISWNPLIC